MAMALPLGASIASGQIAVHRVGGQGLDRARSTGLLTPPQKCMTVVTAARPKTILHRISSTTGPDRMPHPSKKITDTAAILIRPMKRTESRVVVAMAFGALVLLVAIFARIMNYEMRRDEQLFVPPAVVLEQYDLYADIFYNHVPGSAWLFRLVTAALGTDHLLMTARLCVFGGWLLFGTGIAWITYAVTRSLTMTLFALLLILTNDALLTVTGMTATNNLLPLPFAYLGLGLFVLGVAEERGRPLLVAASGLSLSIAAGMKISAAGFIPLTAIAAFLLPVQANFASRFLRVVLPLAAGGIIGALPVLFYFAVDPERFLAHVIGFHTGPHIAYWAAQTGATADVAMSAVAKARLAYLVWFNGANVVFAFAIVYVLALLAYRDGFSALPRKLLTGPVLLVSAALLTMVVLSFVPTPSFPQYFAPPLVCASLLLALLYARLDVGQRLQAQPALIAASVVLVIVGLPRLTQHLGRLPDPGTWTVSQVHQDGLAIAGRISDANVAGKVATLAPIYPLEANLAVYPELATGQFAYRIAEFTDKKLGKHFRMTSPTAIEALFEAEPPAALLVGFAPGLEAPMVRFAEENGYLRVDGFGIDDRYGRGVLYVKPSSSAE